VQPPAMSNPGVGAGGATATVAAAASQKQRALLQKADADVGSLVANLSALIDIARVNDPPVHNSHVAFQMDGVNGTFRGLSVETSVGT
uniref:Uncharacterized protein n=1 Tax=Aegilops tauschii subsp. strangulata TaxID=200361 RepID=A0A453MUX1_AEGTS